MPEDMHVKGERGVYLARRWLESTTFFDMPHNAYGPPQFVTYKLHNGKMKTYDLVGRFMGDRKNEVACEIKNYSTEGGQGVSYPEFVANSYSISYREHADGVDRERYYFWVTWHPFSVTDWSKLTSPEFIQKATETHQTLAAGTAFDVEYAKEFSQRLWINVLNTQVESVTMTPPELQRIRQYLERE